MSPDVMLTMGIPKEPLRNCYLLWEERKAPDFVLEITSKTTRGEDMKQKFGLYRDVLRVSEYFLFDPRAEYLKPPLQGFLLTSGEYVPIELVAGLLPSQVLGLHLERDGEHLRLFDPATGSRLMTPLEAREAAQWQAEAAQRQAEAAQGRAEAAEAAERRVAPRTSASAGRSRAFAADDGRLARGTARSPIAVERRFRHPFGRGDPILTRCTDYTADTL